MEQADNIARFPSQAEAHANKCGSPLGKKFVAYPTASKRDSGLFNTPVTLHSTPHGHKLTPRLAMDPPQVPSLPTTLVAALCSAHINTE